MDSLNSIVNAFNQKVPALECVANNIANLKTPGFKAERLFYKMLDPTAKNATYVSATSIDFTPGVMQKTGNVLDCAIQNDGFFVIETKQGEAYTKKGNFTLSKDRELMTYEGDYVLGDSGRISITGKQVKINQRGEIIADDAVQGKLKIVKFDKQDALVKAGKGLFKDPTKGRYEAS